MNEVPPLEIQFGDVFTSVYRDSKQYVVTSLESSYVGANAIFRLEDGREALNTLTGSTTRSDIGKIIGRWPLDKIIEALRLGHQITYSENPSLGEKSFLEYIAILEEESQKPPILLR